MNLITDGIYYKGTVNGVSPYQKMRYEIGVTYTADLFDTNSSVECSHGLYVCETVAQALRWGKDVFKVQVPDDAIMVRAGSKLRVNKLTVLAQINLRYTDLRHTDLRRAKLHGADLRGADLRYAKLHDADLRDADLRFTELHGADLRYADLRDAELSYAKLQTAKLHGADLRGANLYSAELYGATADQATRWPDGFDFAAAGVVMSDGQSDSGSGHPAT